MQRANINSEVVTNDAGSSNSPNAFYTPKLYSTPENPSFEESKDEELTKIINEAPAVSKVTGKTKCRESKIFTFSKNDLRASRMGVKIDPQQPEELGKRYYKK